MTTLTHDYAAVQLLGWHLLMRMEKIYRDQERLSKKRVPSDPKRRIKMFAPAAYTTIDMIAALEHADGYFAALFKTSEAKLHLDEAALRRVSAGRKLTKRWKAVRNKLGGHVDFGMVRATCERHGFVGTLVGDLEVDLPTYNALLIAEAINSARSTADLFGYDLDARKAGFSATMLTIVTRLNEDWNDVMGAISDANACLLKGGRSEKLRAGGPIGLVHG